MKHLLMLLALIGLGWTASAVNAATIVVGGNELLVDANALEAVGGRVYVKDIQVWPAVQRPMAERAQLLLDTAPALTTSTHEANMAARAKERLLHSQGYDRRAIADSIAAFYRSCTALVKDASVDPQSGQVWIVWSAGKREEWTLSTTLGTKTAQSDPAVAIVNLWRQMLLRGCTIYVGDGYELYVPARRSAVQATLKQTLIKRRLTKVNNGPVSDDGVEHLENKEAEVLRDLQFPQPLDSLRTRR